jgi:chemosensory pili system protein ChpA (sensor histidine kinase/response regulator)
MAYQDWNVNCIYKDMVKKILIVDDIPDERLLTRMVLERHNFSVVDAGSWENALEAIAEDDLDLIILDVQMPELDFAKLLQIIRTEEHCKDIPVILYTSIFVHPFSENEKKEYQTKGATAIVRKDDDSSVLLQKVQELLRLA